MIRKILKGCRPATLVVTIISTTIGIAAAYNQHYIFKDLAFDIWRIFLLTISGIFLQSGMNLINNFFEEEVSKEILEMRTENFLKYKRSKEEILFFKAGLIFFCAAGILGLYLSLYTGWQLFLIEIVGLFSAYAYSGEPFKYKNYGLGAIMSFIMMGPLMTYASYYIFSHKFSMVPILYTMAEGLYIPAILLGNEIRDYEEDRRKNIGTLTVRVGFDNGKKVYYGLIILVYINTLILILFRLLPIMALILFITIPLVKKVKTYVEGNRKLIIPQTAKSYLVFGILFIVVLFLSN